MRGKVKPLSSCWPGIGITPAHAGKRVLRAASVSDARDHPRTCGEKLLAGSRTRSRLGSPPHMRGKDAAAGDGLGSVGITPAHAGKSKRVEQALGVHRDHPRTCGEKGHRQTLDAICMGSPPHMRGKGADVTHRPANPGITPAHAGKSLFSVSMGLLFRDHPRTCGEKVALAPSWVPFVGSPPHMRGKARVDGRRLHSRGITPAHAGKSAALLWLFLSLGDHPRTCGEKLPASPGAPLPAGSPPHMRGKAPVTSSMAAERGITPAHAGKRYAVRSAFVLPWDHPRTCGEKASIRGSVFPLAGSPPHMRGKVLDHPVPDLRHGITPAHAGKRFCC